MSDSERDRRRYSEEEVGLILRRATEIQRAEPLAHVLSQRWPLSFLEINWRWLLIAHSVSSQSTGTVRFPP